MSIGQTVVILTAGIDLSVGTVMAFGQIVMTKLAVANGVPAIPAIALGILACVAFGALNGGLVTGLKLPAFIVTLGTLFAFRGLTIAVSRQLTRRTQLGGLDEASGFGPAQTLFASDLFGGFRVSVLWWLALAALATWVLLRTRFGNWIFAAGGAPEAASRAHRRPWSFSTPAA